jgi:hypothetical protein
MTTQLMATHPGPGGIGKLMALSSELAVVVGTTEESRSQVSGSNCSYE